MDTDSKVLLQDFQRYSFFSEFLDEPWFSITNLPLIIKKILLERSTAVDEAAWVHPSAQVHNSVVQFGAKIFEGATVRDSIILPGATVGHGSEVARSIIGTESMIPRMNYVGSSLLGVGVQLGGLTMLASRRHDRQNITLHWGLERIELGVDQFGSIVGDGSVIAYGTHLNPGTVVAHDAWIMPHGDIYGYTPPHTVTRSRARVTRFLKPKDARIIYEDTRND